MRFNNQTKIALATAACLVAQGYAFDFILKVQPHTLVIFSPLILYIGYLIFRARIDPQYQNPLYWIAAVVVLTLSNLGMYSF
ncbi:MAG: hypothetical protein GKC10_05795 [Methanosarcinales archaeon]|nr:hypothetical protein [Methanosarcinales archaeon]